MQYQPEDDVVLLLDMFPKALVHCWTFVNFVQCPASNCLPGGMCAFRLRYYKRTRTVYPRVLWNFCDFK